MAKRLLILALASFAVSFAAAQKVQLGARAGIFSQDLELKPEDLDGRNILTDARLGFHVAAVARIRLAEVGTGIAGMGFYFQPEIVYSQNKYRVKPSSNEPSAGVRLQAIDIPLLLGFKVGVVRVLAGPVINAMHRSPSDTGSVELMWKKPSVGYSAGISVDVFSGLTIDCRFNGQFAKLKNSLTVNGDSLGDSVRGSLSGWALGASWMF